MNTLRLTQMNLFESVMSSFVPNAWTARAGPRRVRNFKLSTSGLLGRSKKWPSIYVPRYHNISMTLPYPFCKPLARPDHQVLLLISESAARLLDNQILPAIFRVIASFFPFILLRSHLRFPHLSGNGSSNSSASCLIIMRSRKQ